MRRRTRKIVGSGLTAAAVTLVAASSAWACVIYKGDLTVTGSVRASNLMTGAGSSHAYCTGREPTTAAAGPATSTVTADFDPATACTGASNQLPDGTYDVKLRNTTGGFTRTGSGAPWTQSPNSGCWSSDPPSNPGTIYTLGTVTIASGSGSGSWTIPSGATTTNGVNDASVFCVAKQPASGASDGFLAPFRVSTV